MLRDLGFDTFFDQALPHLKPAQKAARVVGEEKGYYRVQFGSNSAPVLAELAGKIHHKAKSRWDYPAVGDFVIVKYDGEQQEAALIEQVLKRKTCLTRKAAGKIRDEQILAANIDVVFLVSSLNDEFNSRRLERFLAMAHDSGASAVILLSKADLCKDTKPYLKTLKKIANKTPVHVLNFLQNEGQAAVYKHLKTGQTAVLLGSSGVGKSTLLNSLLGEAVLKTQAVSELQDKGKHTTSSRYLFVLPNGGMLIDTPGLREIQILDHEEGLEKGFLDIEMLAQNCKFRNCGHNSEPHCAVREAIQSGKLNAERLASFNKLQTELAQQAKKFNKALKSEERTQWKKGLP